MTRPQFLLQPLAAALLLSINPAFSHAEDTPTHNLTPIVVTSQNDHLSNGLMIQADPKQPIQPVPATDGADYLQSIMGFNAIRNGGSNGDVTFRGMFGSRIKILTDGTENLGACPGRMDAPTSYINPESYDQITVIKGPETVQYATTGSAATVLFKHKPVHFQPNQNVQGQASVLVGRYGRVDHNLETAVGRDDLYARLNANRSVSNDYQDGHGNSVHSSWEKWNADLALGWKPTQDTWLELRGGTSDGNAAYAGRGMDGAQFKRQSLGLHAEQQNISDVIRKVEAQIDYNYNDHIMDNFSLRTPVMRSMASEVSRRTLNARTAITTTWDKLSIVSGLDSQHNQHVNNGRKSLAFQSYGAFSEWNYALSDSTNVVTGARLGHVEFNNNKNNQNRTETNPSGFIRLENSFPQYDLTTYAGIGYVERTPDYWELVRASRLGKTLADLKTEKTTQLDIGFNMQHQAWNVWASAYAGLINNFILVGYQDTPSIRNVDAVIAGAEAGVGYQFTNQLQADVSTMYAWGQNSTDHRPLPQIAPLEARFNLRYTQDQYSLGLLWRVVAAQNRVSLNEGNIVGYDMSQSKAFNTFAINAAYKITSNLDVAIGIDNLFNRNYAEHLNKSGAAVFGYAANEQFNNMGRNYWLRMSMKF
ncbi:TonB-dependent copper receptor [Acinetobacter sp. MD2]|uniref:TonB-dependent copper receptor n=1 Tax=Acinetobacter sp. MD2 TaxID=2600066 RepID=UPI002D1F6DB5|nr:TonB-dependent copper receptor [Acinetobacter sp. MD2]MEB3766636.1 TonB-dependent copper receptor [Acinetobacter sp. MD2]